MTGAPYLSRVRLRRDASVKALLPLLLDNQSRHPGHHLVWSLFAGAPDRKRCFLWREMEQGTFLVLSTRPPEDQHGLFEIDEPKPFEPVLAAGDRLRFSLRANPVVRRRIAPHHRSSKHDVVMDVLYPHTGSGRAEHRFSAVREQGFAWLERQAVSAGFAVRQTEVVIDGYRQHRVSRKGKAASMSFSTLDFEGVLEVRDPAVFLARIARGFGAAKAYGCGLLLIRRA